MLSNLAVTEEAKDERTLEEIIKQFDTEDLSKKHGKEEEDNFTEAGVEEDSEETEKDSKGRSKGSSESKGIIQ